MVGFRTIDNQTHRNIFVMVSRYELKQINLLLGIE